MLRNRVNRVLFLLLSLSLFLLLVPVASGFDVLGETADSFGPDTAVTTDSVITGTVYESGGSAIPDLNVYIWREADGWGNDTCTDSNGVYIVDNLEPGTYNVAASIGWNWCLDAPAQYITKYFDNKNNEDDADDITLGSSQTVEDVDFDLELGGSVSGQVTADVGGAGLGGINVEVYAWEPDDCCNHVITTQTETGGSYIVGALPGGDYRVHFRDPNNTYVPETFDNNLNDDLNHGHNVAVALGAETPNIDAGMTAGGRITGTVTAENGGGILPEIDVTAFKQDGVDWIYIENLRTEENGDYDFTLLPGTYRIEFEDHHYDTYLRQYYNDKPDFDSANPVVVTEGATQGGIDAAMVEGGQVTGTVLDDQGAPLENMNVNIWRAVEDEWGQGTCTESDGSYTLSGLEIDSYIVGAGFGWNWCQDQQNVHLGQYYDHTYDYGQATPVDIDAPGEEEPGVDFDLELGGSISGQVTADDGGAGLGGIEVEAYIWDPDDCCNHVSGATTAGDGTYVIGGLLSGDYRVQFWDQNGTFPAETYDNHPGRDLWTGDNVAVTTGLDTPGINAGLSPGGTITGTVTADSDGSLLPEIDVNAYRWDGSDWTYVEGLRTDENGDYSLTLLPDSYRIEFKDHHYDTYLRQYYDNKPDLNSANPVVVTVSVTQGGIDAAMVEGGQVTGTVLDDQGAPLGNMDVSAGLDDGWGQGTCTEPDGSYVLSGLPVGDYVVEAGGGWNWCIDQPDLYLRQYYDHTDDWNQATRVIIDVPGEVELDIDFDLELGGSFSGEVTADVGGAGLEGINIHIYTWDPDNCCDYFTGAQTEPDGSFVVAGLPGADYRVTFYDPNGFYVQETFDDLLGHDPWNGANVAVAAGVDTPGINAGLALGGTITGTVTADSDGSLLPQIDVNAYRWDGSDWTYVEGLRTDENGEYRMALLPGTYRIEFEDHHYDTYLRQYYDNKPDLDSANSVVVTVGVTEGSIDAAMVEGGQVTGTVLDDQGAPLENMNVNIWRAVEDGWGQGACTESDGSYTLSGLEIDSYIVGAGFGWNWCQDQQNVHLGQYYDHTYDYGQATPVDIDAPGEEEPGVDFDLELGGSISGQVVEDDGGAGLGGIEVEAYIWDPDDCCDHISSATTAGDGSYVVGGLASGAYRVHFYDPNGIFPAETYDNHPGRDLWTGDNVAVTTGLDTPGINAGLSPGGTITGTVTADSDGSLLPEIDVNAYRWDGSDWTYVEGLRTDENGDYSLTLLPDSYRIEFKDHHYDTYLRQYYDNKPDLDSANPVVVTVSVTQGGIDAAMVEGGQVTGTVRDDQGAPLENINVNIWRAVEDGWGQGACTESDGSYTLSGLETDSYIVGAGFGWNWCLDQQNVHIGQYYDHTYDYGQATPVDIDAPGEEEPGIDFDLELGGSISGQVVEDDGGAGLGGIEVAVYAWDPDDCCNYVNGIQTEPDGSYVVGGLFGGDYRVDFHDPNGNYVRETFDNIPGHDLWSGANVAVTTGLDTPGINAGLAAGGTITGTVTADSDGSLLPEIDVNAYRWDGSDWTYVEGLRTDENGAYSLALLPDSYRIEFKDHHYDTYLRQYYDNQPDLDSANPVLVTVSVTQGGIDAAMVEGGRITGTVLNDQGAPLGNVNVNAGLDDGWDRGTCTEADGSYTLSGLLLGDYVVEAGGGWNGCLDQPSEFIRQYYDHTYDYGQATPVDIDAPGEEEPGVDFDLELGGSISGQVTADDGGAGLGGIEVEAYIWDPDDCCNHVSGATTAGDGTYVIGGLFSGDYRVDFRDTDGNYVRETYDNIPGQNLWSGDNVAVTAGLDTPGINAGLAEGGTITGTVTADSDGSLLPEIEINAYRWDGSDWVQVESRRTDENGAYSMTLLPDSYRILFEDYHYDTYLRQYYDNQPDLDSATPVVVTASVTQGGIDAAMVEGGHITGTVTSDNGSDPREGISVDVYEWDPDNCCNHQQTVTTGADGSYDVGGLSSGAYAVEFSDPNAIYIRETYDNIPGHDLWQGTPVAVTAGQTSGPVDADLETGGNIEGTVVDAADGTPLANIQVEVSVYDPDCHCWPWVGGGSTDENGYYLVGAFPELLTEDGYHVSFWDPAEVYAPEVYDDRQNYDFSRGEAVYVALEQTTTVDADLAAGAHFQGLVTADADGAPLDQIDVNVYRFTGGEWQRVYGDRTRDDGTYNLTVAPDIYKLEFWDHHRGIYLGEYYNDETDIGSANLLDLTGGGTYFADASLADGITHVIQLEAGWNMISSYINPSNCDLSSNILQDIVDQMVLMKNGYGDVFWPAMGIDDIGCWNWDHGYQIYMDSPAALSITGRMVDTAVDPINLDGGWSLIPYSRESAMPVEPALASLSGLLHLAKNGHGEVYWPAYGVDQIGDMQPGQGYQVYLDASGALIYP